MVAPRNPVLWGLLQLMCNRSRHEALPGWLLQPGRNDSGATTAAAAGALSPWGDEVRLPDKSVPFASLQLGASSLLYFFQEARIASYASTSG